MASCLYNEDMNGKTEDAVRRALELHPGSIRSLALEAGLSPRLLVLIRDGQRRATRATAEKLVAALERWTERTTEAARVLRDSLDREEDER
jgi:hypothetical protein